MLIFQQSTNECAGIKYATTILCNKTSTNKKTMFTLVLVKKFKIQKMVFAYRTVVMNRVDIKSKNNDNNN